MARMPKRVDLKIAFNPLNDAALIVVAEALGFYESEGLDVTLMREANWSTVRDKLAYGLADAVFHHSVTTADGPPGQPGQRRLRRPEILRTAMAVFYFMQVR